MSDVICEHRANGAVQFISPAAETLLGVPASTLMGHGLFDLVHVTDRPAYLTALSDAARGQVARSVEFRVKREHRLEGVRDPRVSFVWIEMRCRPLREEGSAPSRGHASEVVTVLRDISDRKAQEYALDVAREEAEKADATKSRFLATMSHELRTPLNAVIGFSEMIVREKELHLDAARRKEYAQLINDSGQHLLSVVNGILDMSKMQSGGFEIFPEPFMPRQAILNCCNLMALKARDGGIDLAVRISEDLPGMIGDQQAFKQIMLNLLSNAVKFTERGGSVNVAAVVENQNLIVQVIDNGIGIGAEDLKRIGDPFFQAGKTYQRRHEGTGLGLSIVKALVELHHGVMSVSSRLDEGTAVTITLPLDIERAAPRPTSTVTPLASVRGGKFDVQVKRSA
jgi:cell cycle sensor histidine kinase DivJ